MKDVVQFPQHECVWSSVEAITLSTRQGVDSFLISLLHTALHRSYGLRGCVTYGMELLTRFLHSVGLFRDIEQMQTR